MIKKIIFLILIAFSLEAKIYTSFKQKDTKDEAIQEAVFSNFKKALVEVLGDAGYDGALIKFYKIEIRKDFEAFKNEYIEFSNIQCKDKKDSGFYCEVQSSINSNRLRRLVKKSSNSKKVMGKHRLNKLNLVLIDKVNTKNSKSFINSLQASFNKTGHSLTKVEEEVFIKKKDSRCRKIKRNYLKYKKKGASYKNQTVRLKEELDSCNEDLNKNLKFAESVEYIFSLVELEFSDIKKTDLDEIEGTLSCQIDILNKLTGQVEQSIDTISVNEVDDNKRGLELTLYKTVAKKATRELTTLMMDNIASKQIKKEDEKINNFEYMWTVTLLGVTADRQDSSKRKIMKSVMKKFGRPNRDSQESKDNEQVYSFGTNDDIDVEDFMDEMYDAADSVGFKIQITDNGNNIVTIQFQ